MSLMRALKCITRYRTNAQMRQRASSHDIAQMR